MIPLKSHLRPLLITVAILLLIGSFLPAAVLADSDDKKEKSSASQEIEKRRPKTDEYIHKESSEEEQDKEKSEEDTLKNSEKKEQSAAKPRPVGGMGMGEPTPDSTPPPAPVAAPLTPATLPAPTPVVIEPVAEKPPGFMNRIWFTPASSDNGTGQDSLMRAATTTTDPAYPSPSITSTSNIVFLLILLGGTAAYFGLRKFRQNLDRID